MKKVISILLTIALMFAMGAVTVFAAGTVNVTESGLTTVESNTVYHGNGIVSADPVRVTLTADLVLDGSTFENGAILEVNAAGFNVTIKNCKFYGSVGAYNYACAIDNAGNVTIENNIVDGSWRAFNVSINSSASKLTAVGNSITLTKITVSGKEEKNVGIQVYGGNWEGANIIINGNTFKNATTAFRLHYSFAFAASHENDVIVLGKNTRIDCVNFVGYDAGDGGTTENEQAKRDALAAIVGRINTSGDTTVTANADVTYTVIIPSSVDFGTIAKNSGIKTKPFSVSVQNALLEVDHTIKVTNTNTTEEMKMYAGSKTLEFTFTPSAENFIFAGDGTQTGGVTCDPSRLTAAGSYKGYMTFSVVYAPVI